MFLEKTKVPLMILFFSRIVKLSLHKAIKTGGRICTPQMAGFPRRVQTMWTYMYDFANINGFTESDVQCT